MAPCLDAGGGRRFWARAGSGVKTFAPRFESIGVAHE
jgi:hypothetical protein